MSTYVVKATERGVVKGATGSVLAQKISYVIDDVCPTGIPVTIGMNVVMPDVFEIEAESPEYGVAFDRKSEYGQSLSDKIATTINGILINRRYRGDCPICGRSVHHTDGEVMCVNIDCTPKSNTFDILRHKFKALNPNISDGLIDGVIVVMTEHELARTVTSSISAIKHWIDAMAVVGRGAEIPTLIDFIGDIRDITLSGLLTAVIGAPLPTMVGVVVEFYNDSISDILEDVPTVFGPLVELDVHPNLRIMLANILHVNSKLIRLILN